MFALARRRVVDTYNLWTERNKGLSLRIDASKIPKTLVIGQRDVAMGVLEARGVFQQIIRSMSRLFVLIQKLILRAPTINRTIETFIYGVCDGRQ